MNDATNKATETHLYTITNQTSGADLGTYEGTDENDALDTMARDAGYDGFAASCLGRPVASCKRELHVTLV